MTDRPTDGPVRVMFFGSGGFAVPILDTLAAMPAIRLVGVVSVPDRPAGRGARVAAPPVADRARELGVPVLQPPRLRDPETLAAISAFEPDVAVLADYGRLVPPVVLAIPSRGFLNLHPSVLPRHRGATPIQATIVAGDDVAGVSLFEMDAGLDTGPVVAQVSWPLAGTETAPELEATAAGRAAALLRETLGPWLAGEKPAHAQGADGVTVTRPLSREDGRLDPAAGVDALARRVRALLPWPGTFVETTSGRLGVLRAAAARGMPGDRPGEIVGDGDGLALTADDGRLALLEVRPAGGRSMTASELRRGRPAFAGATVVPAPPTDRPVGAP